VDCSWWLQFFHIINSKWPFGLKAIVNLHKQFLWEKPRNWVFWKWKYSWRDNMRLRCLVQLAWILNCQVGAVLHMIRATHMGSCWLSLTNHPPIWQQVYVESKIQIYAMCADIKVIAMLQNLHIFLKYHSIEKREEKQTDINIVYHHHHQHHHHHNLSSF